ncbi:1-deoxy-D-xylulose-5-phosphate reductoisomerase [Candidatus Nanopelagicus limnes]|uniref:1-deoxy-D-xylulose 5-phosphate reductoisomerase n=1 Tax=Candidatus Nanopelagicus limnae TaxID=1884634 RepID=A0A249JYH1_9ACTN|nr:1-deoxy-D-xylulose-5-phosphate reductoisomerase [Candidatus Nanopelagicus limnes]ASY09577.1 1-deoxy-D-xylulose-5-phosphate reductoisomerase [Candidatus Nanopelagicus limnes]
MRDVVVLGSTGSIGVQALEIVAAHPNKFRLVGLSGGRKNPQLLMEQAKKFNVPIVGSMAPAPKTSGVQVIDGDNSSIEIAALPCDIVLNGITGSIGLGPTLSALGVGNKVALANKESLVAGGDLVMKFGADKIIPVDSEHSAIFQALLAGKVSDVKKLILTASGGPFRNRADLSDVTVADALNHPTWSMGEVVTINSATLLNKGLEIIEAHYLFGLDYENIEAVIHPQSVVHSLVEYVDGSTIAQASPPNMKGPIAYALSYPERINKATAAIDWSKSHTWEFSPIDNEKYPAIELAKRCGQVGAGLPAVYNAANEVAVAAFLAGQIKFTAIIDTVESVVQSFGSNTSTTIRDISDVSGIEQSARSKAAELIKEIA